MNHPEDSAGSNASRAISKSVPGPDFLRYYPGHRLMAWQPQGTLDDFMVDQIAECWSILKKHCFRSSASLISVS
jgi:hypothetical protein